MAVETMLMERRQYAPNRIRQLRVERKMSQEALGLAMQPSLTGSTIAKLETGRQALSADYIFDIARVLQCSPADLLIESASSIRMVPVIDLADACNWREAVTVATESTPVSGDLACANLFSMRLKDDSMNRVVPQGGHIMVDPDDRELRDDGYYIVVVGDNGPAIKQFCSNPMRLVSCSTTSGDADIPLGFEPFVVVGRIVSAGLEL